MTPGMCSAVYALRSGTFGTISHMQEHDLTCVSAQVLHSGDLICEGIIKQQAEPAKAEEPKKGEPAAQEPAPAPPVPTAGVTANVAVISVSHPTPAACSLHTQSSTAECL